MRNVFINLVGREDFLLTSNRIAKGRCVHGMPYNVFGGEFRAEASGLWERVAGRALAITVRHADVNSLVEVLAIDTRFIVLEVLLSRHNPSLLWSRQISRRASVDRNNEASPIHLLHLPWMLLYP